MPNNSTSILAKSFLGPVWIVVGLLGWWFYNPAHEEPVKPAQVVLDELTDLSVLAPLSAKHTAETDDKIVQLGKLIFFDFRLSPDGKKSCASCHGGVQPFPSTITSLQHNEVVRPLGVAPTLLNISYRPLLYSDGRATTLEEQLDIAVKNDAELGTNWESLLDRLKRDDSLVADFRQLFPEGLTSKTLSKAIVAYERTLIATAPFDRFLLGDQMAISELAQRGYALFRTLGCSACHNGRLVGGNIYQRMGEANEYFDGTKTLAVADRGRFNVTHDETDIHVFRVPSLRDASRKATYFHDGAASTLEQAITLMAYHQIGLELSQSEVMAIKAFIESLTSDEVTR